ncbi:MAG TPA: cupredoxin domain-containing protein [Gaiellaceae bacterium]|nr:cupredoxin domain-containing protein [Gaiellaceae bacterium]
MAALFAVCLTVLAAPAFAARAHATATKVSVTESEWKIKLSKSSVPAGSVTFSIKNAGKVPHDFKIGGKKSKTIAPGKTATLTVTLKKGKQAYLCAIPGHAALGMKGTLTVK